MRKLTEADGALVALSAAMGARDDAKTAAALRAAGAVAAADAVEEVLIQSYLFLGYPAALNALAAWRGISGHPAPATAAGDGPWDERGAAVCRTVYGGQYDRLRENIRALHPDMERWMVHEGYGKVLGRPGLPLATRELCIAALLAALDAPKQLYSHLRGALNAGASEGEVEEALEAARRVSAPDVAHRAAEQWDTLRTRMAGES